MRVAFPSLRDARDVKNWSGTEHHMSKCLEDQGIGVEYIGNLRMQKHPVNVCRYLFNKKIRGLNDHPHRDPGFLKHCARQVQQRLRGLNVDMVFGHGTIGQAYLETDLPMAVYGDCTFANLLDYYPKFSNMSARSIRDGHAADKDLLTRCGLVIMSSKWAADSAVKDYGCDPAKVHIVPFGANFPVEHSPADIERMAAAKGASPIRLLLLGVDWHRKGGDTAVGVAKELHRRGVPVELLVVGCHPPEGEMVPDYVKLLGFISKATPEGVARINQLLATSHFFILPTRADCTPIVFSEASSFGLPILATDTGGVASIVLEGRNGRVFAMNAPASEYADFVQKTMADPREYLRLSLSSLDEYRTRLNWGAAGRALKALLEEFLASRTGHRPIPALAR